LELRQFQANYSVSVVQPLLRGGRVYVATQPIRNAEYDWRIAAAQLQADILTVTAQTKSAYYNAVLANKVIDLIRDAIARDERRPEILAAGEALKKSWLDVRVNQNALLPQLNFVGSYGRGETGTTVGTALDFRGDVWTTGLVFSYPLGNVAARSLLSRAKLEQVRFEQELAQTRRLVELQVRAAVIRIRTSLERMK